MFHEGELHNNRSHTTNIIAMITENKQIRLSQAKKLHKD